MTKRNFSGMLNEYTHKDKRPSTQADGGGNVYRIVNTPAKQTKRINTKNPAVNAYKLLKSKG